MTDTSNQSENRTLQAVAERTTQNEGPHPAPKTPDFTAPAGACDTHCHVFGPGEVFPYAEGRHYSAPDAPADMLFALHEKLGIERAVIVHPSCHGTDNRVTLDAMARRPGKYLGVAMVDLDISETELHILDRGGMRGVRFNFLRHLGGPPADMDGFGRLMTRIQRLGWHLVVHLDASQDIIKYSDLFLSLPVPVVIDHMGRVPAGDGPDAEPLRLLLDLLANDTIWIKLSAAERVSRTGEPFTDSVTLGRALTQAAPNRCIWGTDWPHPNMGADGAPDDGQLVDLLPQIAPDQTQRQKLLVDNPQRLYRFPD